MPPTDDARRLAFHAAMLFLLGSLTGFLVAGAMTGAVAAEPKAALASHMNALLGTFLLIGVAFTLPFVRLGPAATRALVGAFVVAGYANWIITAAKSLLFVRGLKLQGSAANDTIFGLLGAFVVVPTLVGAVLWAYGLRGAARAPVAVVAEQH